MAIYLSHTTALSIWLREGGWLVRDGDATRGGSLSDSSASAREVEASGILRRGSIEPPVHAIVDADSKRHRSRLVRAHVWNGKIPLRSFYQLEGDVYVSSPELTIVQEATLLDRVDLAWCISSLCSAFGTASDDPSMWHASFRDAPPITSTADVERFLRLMPSERGTQATSSALRLAVDGAASPPEMALAMMACAPKGLGGYALAKPQLNQAIRLDDNAARMCGKSTVYCDMLFPNRVAVEYDSDEYHSGSLALHEDRARYNALVSMGYRPIAITRQHLSSIAMLDNAFASIATSMGHHWWKVNPYGIGDRQALLERLLDRDGTTLERLLAP